MVVVFLGRFDKLCVRKCQFVFGITMECKAQVFFADIDESFAMIIEPLKSVSIQPSKSPVKFARPLSAYGSPPARFSK